MTGDLVPDLAVRKVRTRDRRDPAHRLTTNRYDYFIKELFGAQSQSPIASSWLPVILKTTKSVSVVRTGLSNDPKKVLLAKYQSKNEIVFLIPPRVNKEILLNLSATVVTQDKHQSQSQLEVSALLNALA